MDVVFGRAGMAGDATGPQVVQSVLRNPHQRMVLELLELQGRLLRSLLKQGPVDQDFVFCRNLCLPKILYRFPCGE